MKLIKPYFEIITPINRIAVLKKIEQCGRVCYKSEDRITEDSASEFVLQIDKRQHYSVLEHEIITVKIVCDRGVSHEIVRHRIASFSQESTRYCNYSKDKFDNQLTFIIPSWLCIEPNEVDALFSNCEKYDSAELQWIKSMSKVENEYIQYMSYYGWTPQQARCVLPNSLKTEIVITANLREWQHIFRLRCDKAAHPQMREIMVPLQEVFRKELPEIFGVCK
ncbi:MAG: FAD-dependent thymidylate synthase [Patescibacteria group bacterium]|jgi:thymidylate synthase (FAD)